MLHMINAIDDRVLVSNDAKGYAHDLQQRWSREIAQRQARKEGLGELSESQWQVIRTLRNLYRKNGRAESARQLIRLLEKDFAKEGGRRYLYEMFPQGPVTQGSRLAGVPTPPYASDPSFDWAD
jgi:tRNA 2-thiouridine synthesizing protein E